MSKTKQTKRVTRRRRDTLSTMLEALPGAFFVLDHADTIVYANASAQAMLGTPPKALCENNFWHCAPHLVSPVLSQAVRQTKQTRALTDVQYVSRITQNWLHVHLAPMVGGWRCSSTRRARQPDLRRCFPRASTSASMTWMVCRSGLRS
ncbi:PAS domain-containing protein [Ktedonobacter sp. SOSP1-52]|uniref:PAS domain-containing protein n=1 Tax=Ktedonobacter sp. SOSP1-52 TaxID=2778366 RepID=UPI0027DC7384|nr:PAS domain-containing protein [Ktedonobacter sp. SOSP1-52]